MATVNLLVSDAYTTFTKDMKVTALIFLIPLSILIFYKSSFFNSVFAVS